MTMGLRRRDKDRRGWAKRWREKHVLNSEEYLAAANNRSRHRGQPYINASLSPLERADATHSAKHLLTTPEVAEVSQAQA